MFSSGGSRRGRRPIISGDPTRGSADRLYSQEEINNNRKISPYNHPFRHPLVTPVKDLDPTRNEGWSERNAFFNQLSNSFVDNVLKYDKCMTAEDIKRNLEDHFNISPADKEVLNSAVYRIYNHPKVRVINYGDRVKAHYIGDGIIDEQQ